VSCGAQRKLPVRHAFMHPCCPLHLVQADMHPKRPLHPCPAACDGMTAFCDGMNASVIPCLHVADL